MNLIKQLTWLQWILLGMVFLIAAGAAGMAFGYRSSTRDLEADLALAMAADLQTQYGLGLQDFEKQNYFLAQQRFEYVLQQDPNFPGVIDMLAKIRIQLSEPVFQITDVVLLSPTPSPTISPTPDTRQVENLYAQAEQQFVDQDWQALVQTIVSLRDIDPVYRAREVDRMLFLGLHFGAIQKILEEGNLEGGLYDLALVERFAPLDSQAGIYQEWARLYQIGVGFWGVLPEKSVFYFGQLASAAPYLRDFSGFYAKERYRQALIQYGDWLSQAGDWCLAAEQYNLAQSLLEEDTIKPTVTFSEQQCSTGGRLETTTPESEIIIPTITLTPSLTETISTPGPTIEITSTPTQIESTLEPTIEITLTPTQVEVTPQPSATEIEPSETPPPTPTPEASP